MTTVKYSASRVTASNASASLIILTLVVMIIGSSVWGLLWYWNSQPIQTTYIVVDVNKTNNIECDKPYTTAVRDSITQQISHKCGNLGEPSEIISLDE